MSTSTTPARRRATRATIAIAMKAKMPAHRRRATTQPVMRRRRIERRRRRVARWRRRVVRQRRLDDKRRKRRHKWGVARCNNQMAKKRSRQSREAESAAARQQGRRDSQLANKRQTGGEAYKTNGRGGVSGQEAAEHREDKRQRRTAAQREASRQPAGGASIGEIRASTIVVVNPLARRATTAAMQTSCGCSDRCSGWCDKRLTWNYDHRWLYVVGVWNSLLASKGGRIFLIVQAERGVATSRLRT